MAIGGGVYDEKPNGMGSSKNFGRSRDCWAKASDMGVSQKEGAVATKRGVKSQFLGAVVIVGGVKRVAIAGRGGV